MRFLGLTLLLVALGCGGADITGDPQIDLDALDSIDADTTVIDADTTVIDADTTVIDAIPIDAPPPADANTQAQAFCDQYETLCGYDAGNNNRFDSEADCLTSYQGFDPAQQTCVEDQLDQLEIDSDLNHCRTAMGRPPCN